MAELKVQGFDELTKKLDVVVPQVLQKMAFSVTAKTAAEGRKREQRVANKLDMGKPQKKGPGGYKVRSIWDPKVGWTSATRNAGKGGTRFRMASFAWERVKKKDQAKAAYSSQLANLWHRPSRPYRMESPEVGQMGRTFRWQRGQRRPVKYRWSAVYNALAQSVPTAIQKTEKEWTPKLLGD